MTGVYTLPWHGMRHSLAMLEGFPLPYPVVYTVPLTAVELA